MGRQRYYRCPDCGKWHRRVQSGNHIPPCSAAMQQRARDYIERLLARAFGHGAEEAILKSAAEQINTWAECSPWGANLRERYAAKNHVLSGYIKADQEKLELLRSSLNAVGRPAIGHNSQLTGEEADLVIKHWPLVDSEARKIAGEDTELNYVLAAVGRAELERAVRRLDRTQNVTFGAFVKERIHGCMVNYLERVRYRKPKAQSWAYDRGKRWFEGLTRRPRSSDRRAPPPESRLIPGERSKRKIEAALAKLNPRQEAVYQGRMLTKPPLSRAVIARQLGITDVTQISRIERQVRRKMRGPK